MEEDGTPHSRGFWRVVITAYVNRVKGWKIRVHAFALCTSLCLPGLPQRATGSARGRRSPVESGTWWPYCETLRFLFSSLQPWLAQTQLLPNYTHPWVIASLPTLLRNDFAAHRIMYQTCLPTFLLDYLFAYTAMQVVPSLLLSVWHLYPVPVLTSLVRTEGVPFTWGKSWAVSLEESPEIM